MINIARVQERMDALGLNPFSAAGRAGLERGYVRDIMREKIRDPGSAKLIALARVLMCSPAYLLGESDERGQAPINLEGGVLTVVMDLPIAHEVAAGHWLAVDEQRDVPLGKAPVALVPEYASIHQWLERVRGDSMDRLLPDGALVHVIDAIGLGYAPQQDDVVVVVRRRAQGAFVERSLKQVSIGQGGVVSLWPRSHNPRWGQALSYTDDVREGDDVEVEIVGKVVRAYVTFGRGFGAG